MGDAVLLNVVLYLPLFGIALIFLIQWLFLGDLRCALIVAVIAVITEPAQIRKIIASLGRHGRRPPHLGRGSTPPLG